MMPLAEQHCQPIPPGQAALSPPSITELHAQLAQWAVETNPPAITREFHFKNYYATQAFVNAVIWIAHREDHHPDIRFSYNRCHIRYSTHSVAGLSRNDFICAAKIDALQA